MKKFIVKSFSKENLKLINQKQFNDIKQCKSWCSYNYLTKLENMNFEIHQTPKESSYLKGDGSKFLTIRWINVGYV
jgi:hypothetical protein